jgi:hypothetical protein
MALLEPAKMAGASELFSDYVTLRPGLVFLITTQTEPPSTTCGSVSQINGKMLTPLFLSTLRISHGHGRIIIDANNDKLDKQ